MGTPHRDQDSNRPGNFLGEVLLNVGKLEPFAVTHCRRKRTAMSVNMMMMMSFTA
jgi:hypothetical protein